MTEAERRACQAAILAWSSSEITARECVVRIAAALGVSIGK